MTVVLGGVVTVTAVIGVLMVTLGTDTVGRDTGSVEGNSERAAATVDEGADAGAASARELCVGVGIALTLECRAVLG